MIFLQLIELYFLSWKYLISKCLLYRWVVERTAESITYMILWLGSVHGNLRSLLGSGVSLDLLNIFGTGIQGM